MNKFISVLFIASTLSACGGGGSGDGGPAPDPATPYEVTYITDTLSTLQWSSPLATGDIDSKGSFSGSILKANQAEAKQLCESLDLAGSADWRLPTANEVDDALNRQQLDLDGYAFYQNISGGGVPDLQFHYEFLSQFHLDGKIFHEYQNGAFAYPTEAHNPVVKLVTEYVGVDLTSVTSLSVEYTQIQNNLGADSVPDPQIEAHVFCVRGTHAEQPVITAGAWQDVVPEGFYQRPVELEVKDGVYPGLVSNVTANEMTYSGLAVTDTCGIPGDCIEFKRVEGATFVRAGIQNVKLKGEFKSFANEAAPKSLNKKGTQKLGGVGIGDIGLIIGNINHYILRPETIDKPAGTTELAADGSGKLIVYCAIGADGRLILDDGSPVTTPSGNTEIEVDDYAGTGASFNVEIIGEETDVGVLNVPEATTLYNFKTSISHGKDYIYFGYNDGETPLSYTKELSICNTGTVDISGTSFVIEVDAANAALVRSFSHNYSGSATGFAAGECKTYTIDMAFNRPLLDDDVKINVTINDNFNSLTWDDYTSFKLSQYEPLPLYFAADSTATFTGTGLQGLLVAPGRQILRVNFTSFAANNFIRVPRKLDDEYQVILATTNIADESTYMISTDQVPNTTLMTGFTNVTINEPDNTLTDATAVPLINGEAIGYLHTGDVDFYRIFNY